MYLALTRPVRFTQRENKTGMSITDHLIDRIIRSESLEPFILIRKGVVTDPPLVPAFSSLLFSPT